MCAPSPSLLYARIAAVPDGEVASVGLVRSQNCIQNCFATCTVRKDDSLALPAETQITVLSVSRVFFVSGGPLATLLRRSHARDHVRSKRT